MRHMIACVGFLVAITVVANNPSLLRAEEEESVGALRQAQEGLKREVKELRLQLSKLHKAIDGVAQSVSQRGDGNRLSSELDDALLSYGNAGLITLLRLEKVKLARKAKLPSVAVEELHRIVSQNLSEATTNVARWTLVEILQEQNRTAEARAELEQMLSVLRDSSRRRNVLYGLIELSGDSPQVQMQSVDRLIQCLTESSLVGRGTVDFPGHITVEPYGNALLTDLHNREGNHITLQEGKQKLCEADFCIGPHVVLLGGRMYKDAPLKVEGIRVGFQFKKLHILHGTGWGADIKTPEGTHIANYVVHYEGSSVEIPVKYGIHVRDWWAGWGDPDDVAEAKLAWKGQNALSPVRLYCMTWENPRPGETVNSIDLISTDSDCAPFVVALTAEGVTQRQR